MTQLAAMLAIGCSAQGRGGSASNRLPSVMSSLPVRRVSVGANHGCVILGNGEVRCWGDNLFDELGTTADQLSTRGCGVPLSVPGATGAIEVVAASSRTCAVLGDGSVQCWGIRRDDPSRASSSDIDCGGEPHVVPGLRSIRELALGEHHDCALPSDGSVLCWGDNLLGQLGDGTTMPRAEPRAVAMAPAVSIAVGKDHSCAVLRDGSVQCWGRNDMGQLGVDSRDHCWSNRLRYPCSRRPLRVEGVADVVRVALGNAHSCALTREGRVFCWGVDGALQAGAPSETRCADPEAARRPQSLPRMCVRRPTEVKGIAPMNRISAGPLHTCVVSVGGEVWCWGALTWHEELVAGSSCSPPNCSAPARIEGIVDAVDVDTGGSMLAHACALRRTGDVLCWGGPLGASPVASPDLHLVPLVFAPSAASPSIERCSALSSLVDPPPSGDGSVPCRRAKATVPAPVEWNAQCLVRKGCADSRTLAPCSDAKGALSPQDILERLEEFEGREVSAIGPLETTNYGCTMAFCGGDRCCNECFGWLVIGDPHDRAGYSMFLRACQGDDSRLCCGVEARGQRVVVKGMLRAGTPPGSTPFGPGGYSIDHPVICEAP